MKRFSALAILFIFSLFTFSCGGGAGSAWTPSGESPGVASVVELVPSTYVAQTNGFVTFNARVLDGNGRPVPNATVTFTNISSLGTLTSALSVKGMAGKKRASATTAVTDSTGIARINVYSTTSGYATIVAQVYTGMGNVRDKKSVFFTTGDIVGNQPLMPVTVVVDIDGNNNGVYNEDADLNVCSASGDNQVKVRTTLYIMNQRASGYGVYVATDANSLVTFPTSPLNLDWNGDGYYSSIDIDSDGDGNVDIYADTPDKDSDGDPDMDFVTTNSQGEAFSEFTVNCMLGGVERVISVYAYTNSISIPEFGNNSYQGVGGQSIFLQPVTVSGITVTANPSVVAASGTSTITATVATTAGTPPDGTTVQFFTTCGTVNPATKTTSNGIATTTFTAPATVPAGNSCTITAKVGNVSGTVDVTFPALSVSPATYTIDNDSEPATLTFSIYGGTAPYTISVVAAPVGGAFTYTPPATPQAAAGDFSLTGISIPDGVTGTITITVTDSASTPAMAVSVVTVVD